MLHSRIKRLCQNPAATFNIPICQDRWRNWREAKGRSAPPGKLNVKTGSPLAEILMFIILLAFSWLLFFCIFRDVFVFLASLDIHDIQLHYRFLTFLWVLASDPLTVANGLPSAKFCPPPLTQPLATPLAKTSYFQRNRTIIINVTCFASAVLCCVITQTSHQSPSRVLGHGLWSDPVWNELP